MSYTFPVSVCDTCGVVRFEASQAIGERGEYFDYACRILLDGEPCPGVVKPFALMDFDAFICRLESAGPVPSSKLIDDVTRKLFDSLCVPSLIGYARIQVNQVRAAAGLGPLE